MEYTIAAIPTLYNGRQYRSRLEARWAAFFDQMKWRSEYEPFDLGAWSPDFLLNIIYDQYLVEVKPLESFSDEVAEKMLGSATKKLLSTDSAPSLLILGVSPVVSEPRGPVRVGWFNEFSEDGYGGWSPCFVGYYRSSSEPIFVSVLTSGPDEETSPLYCYTTFTMAMWAQATNLVQWQARRK